MKKLSVKEALRLGWIVTIGFTCGCSSWSHYQHASHVDRVRNQAWPQPFRSADSVAVVAPFEVMKANGWQEFNTLAQCFFDSSNQLTDAGHLKLHEILTLTPESKNSIFVEKADSQQATAARVESLEIAISGLIPVGPLPQISVTENAPNASSGAYQTMVHRALIRTTPTPRLPKFGALNTPSQNTVAPNANTPGGK